MTKARADGECQCGFPSVTAGVTKVRYLGNKVVACELCDVDLSAEPDEADPNAIHSARVRIIAQRFVKPDGSFCIYQVELDGDPKSQPQLPDGASKPFGLRGPTGVHERGDIVTVSGRFLVDGKYGFQMAAVGAAVPAIKESQAGLVAFLSKFPNIGKWRAEAMLRQLGGLEGVLAALDNEPGKLTQVSGITDERAAEIKAAYDQQAGYREFRVFASKLNIPENVIANSIDEWGEEAQKVILDDPFDLMLLPRVGFKTADEVHRGLGRDLKHPSRCAAGAFMALTMACDDGHTYCFDTEIRGEGRGRAAEEVRKLGLTSEEVESGLEILSREQTKRRRRKRSKSNEFDTYIVPPRIIREEGRVYLANIYQAEVSIAKELARISTANLREIPIPEGLWESILGPEKKPAPEQEEALQLVLAQPIVVVTGGPGCIDADTELLIETEGRRGKGGRIYTVEAAFRKFHRISRPGNGGTKFWRGRAWTLSQVEDGGINYNEIKNIVFNGVKQVFAVQTKGGRRVRVTDEHPFKVPAGTRGADEDGYKPLRALRPGDVVVVRREEAKTPIGSTERNNLYRREIHAPFHPKARVKTVHALVNRTTGETRPYEYGLVREARLALEAGMNGLTLAQFITRLQTSVGAEGLRFLAEDLEVHHHNENVTDNRAENLKALTKAEHARSHGHDNRLHFGNQLGEEDVIVSITLVGERPVYDLVMADPYRNYVANGFVLHNCGKTASTRAFLDTLTASGLEVVLCAPTGKAAKRLSELTGRPAGTIHRLTARARTSSDAYHLRAGVVVVDEASMVDVELASRLLECVQTGARLIIVGDVDQLPSIGPGRFLFDLIESGIVPVVRLTRIFRQAEESRIPYVARDINSGVLPDLLAKGTDVTFLQFDDAELLAAKVVKAVTEQLPAKFPDLKPEDFQVISPQKGEEGKTNWPIGTKALNMALQDVLNPRLDSKELHIGEGYIARVGDRVIHCKNNYGLTVMNGELGQVIKLDTRPFIADDGIITSQRTQWAKDNPSAAARPVEVPGIVTVVDYGDSRRVGYTKEECRELQLSYALTCHKCQGSEYKVVVMPVHDVHHYMLTRPLLYTAITRATKYVLLLGQMTRVGRAIDNRRGVERRTSLQDRLKTAFAVVPHVA